MKGATFSLLFGCEQNIFQVLFDWLWLLTAQNVNPDASRNISISIWLAVVADCTESQSWRLKKYFNLFLTGCDPWLRQSQSWNISISIWLAEVAECAESEFWRLSICIWLAVVADCAESESWRLKKYFNLDFTDCSRWLRGVWILTPQEIFQSLFDWLWSLTAKSLNPDSSRNISIFIWLAVVADCAKSES